MPGFKTKILIKRLPRFIFEQEGRKMGLQVAQGVTEKGIIRIIKIIANK